MTAYLRLVPDLQEPFPGPGDNALLGALVRFGIGTARPDTVLQVEHRSAHLARFGERPVATGSAAATLLETLENIELTGRGGGHFPVARKWRAQLTSGGAGVVVANASESEPASAKDAALVLLRPHLVIDGLALAAEAVAADDAVIWLHEGARAAHATLSRALAERRASSMTEPRIRIVTGPHRYLSGESSAIVRALSGGPALPQFRRVPATTSGVGGRPTLVQNVETLARVAVAARSGPHHYRASTLLTLSQSGVRTVVEVDTTARISDVVRATSDGGAPAPPPQAVLVGGYGGYWRGWDELADLHADEKAFADKGISLGAGVLLPLAANECGISMTARIADYLARSSARQCGPCLFGLRSVADLFSEVAYLGARRRDVRRLQRFLDEIVGRGGCHHPDGAVRMVSSAIQTFEADLELHVRRGRCRHGGDGSNLFQPEFS